MSNERKSLYDFMAEQLSAQLPLMEGREKGDIKEIMSQVITITDYGFMTDDKNEEYACFIIAERPGKFYFGGKVINASFKLIDENGYRDELLAGGWRVVLTDEKTKDGKRNYTKLTQVRE